MSDEQKGPRRPHDPARVPAIENWDRLLEGRVAVVSGSGAGIGAAIAKLFAAHGALVEMAEVDEEAAAQTLAAIEQAGDRARAHHVDVRRQKDIETLRRNVLAEHGRIDILVNNVGDYRPLVRFRDSTPESWRAMYEINLQHVFAMTQAFLASMIDARRGVVVNIHSVEGMRGFPGDPVYASMKAAVAHFTTSLAVTHGRDGIRVNGIGTDLTQTPQVDYTARAEGCEELWESWAPVGRMGWPEDQARVALFLASDLSAFVTGANLPVDGGTLAGGGWFFSPGEKRFTNRPKL